MTLKWSVWRQHEKTQTHLNIGADINASNRNSMCHRHNCSLRRFCKIYLHKKIFINKRLLIYPVFKRIMLLTFLICVFIKNSIFFKVVTRLYIVVRVLYRLFDFEQFKFFKCLELLIQSYEKHILRTSSTLEANERWLKFYNKDEIYYNIVRVQKPHTINSVSSFVFPISFLICI